MLDGCTPWPEADARRYRQAGLWEGLTLGERFRRTVARRPGHVALVHGDDRWTYADLAAAVDAQAADFLDAGLEPLDRVVVQLPNVAAFVTTYLALVGIGAIPVMALRAHRAAEVRHFLTASKAVAWVGPDRIRDFDYRAMVAGLAPACPAMRHVFVAGVPGPGQRRLLDPARDGASRRPALPSIDASEVCTMLLSGGTTSMSKLIPRTHDDFGLNARLCSEVAGFGADTVHLVVLPLGHNYNLGSPGMLGVFHAGGTVVLADGADAAGVFPRVEREGVTSIAAAVPLIAAWLASDVPDRHDLGSLRVVSNGGARLAPELRVRLQERFGCVAQEIYGTAEGLINMTRLDDTGWRLLESSGTPVSEFDELRVVDDAGNEVADGEPGELLTRGPYTICGYYDAPAKNREAFVDGWYRMGDVVRKQGRYVSTEGRRKDMINRGGEKINCEEVENLIYGHPAVRTVTLVGMPCPRMGERACAFVVLHAGATLTFAELVAHLRAQRIAAFKLPERLEVVDALPTSPVGKILKRELRDRIAAKLEGEAATAARGAA